MSKRLGRWLLRRELEAARTDLARRIDGAVQFSDLGQSYSIGRIDGLRQGLDHVTQLATGRYPAHPVAAVDPIAEAER